MVVEESNGQEQDGVRINEGLGGGGVESEGEGVEGVKLVVGCQNQSKI